jgi:hypothetical protein
MIPLDQFFSVAPETNFLACGYANLGGVDLLFYVSTTNELRVQAFGSTNFTTLIVGCTWVDVVSVGTVAHVYFINMTGQVFHFQYDGLGPVRHPVTIINGIPTAVTISAIFAHTSTPNVYILMLDDGQTHWLFTSAVETFTPIINTLAVYSNLIDPAHFASKPTIKMHPGDTHRATVIIQRLLIASQQNTVGFYVVPIPGVI